MPSTNPAGGPKQHLRTTPWTDEQMAEALRASHGVYADAARYLTRKYGRKCHRGTVSQRIEARPELKKLVQRIRESALDFVEKRMWNRIESGDPRMIAYYLNTFGQDRGYGRKKEFFAQGEGTFKIQISETDAQL